MINGQTNEGLGCCSCDDSKLIAAGVGLTCEDKKNIFTKREHEVLSKIREASLRAGALKAEIANPDGRRAEAARLELQSLRQMRTDLEKERIAASDERMRLLGHL